MTSISSVLHYIDPGTGSMLLTIIVGVITAVSFAVKKVWMKFKFSLLGGRQAAKESIDGNQVPVVMFSDGKQYWNTFLPVCKELDRRGINAEYWGMASDDPVFDESFTNIKTKCIGSGNIAFARLNAMNAGICLATTPGLDVFQWKRSPKTRCYAHVLHAIDDGTLYRMFGLDYYDCILAPNNAAEASHRKLEEIRHLPGKEFHIVGLPYLDALLERISQADEGASGASADSGTPVVLLAPTWGPNGLLTRFGQSIIDALVSTGYQVIVRPHPQSKVSEADMLKSLQDRNTGNPQIEWDYSSDNFDALRRASIMVSDYSGVTMDFALAFGKPFLYANAEIDVIKFDADWLEDPLWILSVIEQLGRPIEEEDFPHLRDIIDDMISTERDTDERRMVRDEVWQQKGCAASNIADFLENKAVELGIDLFRQTQSCPKENETS